MAEGQIKKGFFFYFGLFVLLVVAVVLVLMVIMIFNPGKSIAWMQYFTGNGKYVELTTTTDTKATIDWINVNDITIECGYADITIEKNNNKNMPHNSVYISNGAKGFQLSNGAVGFSYTVQYVDGNTNAVKISVQEPNGFLYFSDKIEIVVHYDDETGHNFTSKNFTLITTSGDIDIGGSDSQKAKPITINSVKATTESGTISISNTFETESVIPIPVSTGDFVFETTNGKITSTKSVDSYNGKNYGISFPNASSLKINVMGKGKIDLPVIKFPNKTLNLISRRGVINVDYIEAAEINVESIEGNHLYGNVKGNLSYNNSLNEILSPNITIQGTVDGNFSVAATQDNSAPKIKIAQVTGTVHVDAKNGWLEIGNVKQSISLRGEGISADLTFDKNYDASIDIETNSSVTLSFAGRIPSNGTVKAAGNVNIYVTNQASFVAQIYKFDANKSNPADEDKISKDKINTNIGGSTKEDGEFRVGSSENLIKIFTNGNANFNLI